MSGINSEKEPLLTGGAPRSSAKPKAKKTHFDFGEEPPYDNPSPEDKANLLQRAYFNYIGPYIHKAAEEKLEDDFIVYPLWRGNRAWNKGTEYKEEYTKRLRRFHLWDKLVGQNVVKEDSAGKWSGVLRFVGQQRNSLTPKKVVAGVEWTNVPRDASTTTFHNGTVHGEFLFDAPSGRSTIEDPSVLRFTAPECKRIAGGNAPATPSSFKALFSCYGAYLVAAGIPRLIFDVCTLSIPIILELYVDYLGDSNSTWADGLEIVAATFGVTVLQSLCFHRHFYMTMRSGLECSSALQALTFQRAFHITQKGRADPDLNAGRVVTLLSVDAFNVEFVCWWVHYLWSVPFQLCVGVYLLYRLVNWAAFTGIAVMLLSMPLTAFIGKIQHSTQEKLIKITDERVKATNELFNGIRIVKYMGWEKKFSDKIIKLRTQELSLLRRMQYFRVANQFVTAATPPLIIATVFIVFHVAGHTLTPKIVFPTISLLQILRIPFMVVPMLVQQYVSAWVSLKRFDSWLSAEADEDAVLPPAPTTTVRSIDPTASPDQHIGLINATIEAFTPEPLPDVDAGTKGMLCCKKTVQTKDTKALVSKVILKDVTVNFPKGKLTVIAGPTGSGKTALLEALLGNLNVSEGTASCGNDNVAYVPQQPWVMNETVQNNITFFSDLDQRKLDNAVAVSQMTRDVELFDNGLATELGEKGVSMSGGQKARLCVARAVYADRGIYLLDDPISAVDTKVGEAMITECVCGALAGKTVVLVTHHVHHASKADHFIHLNKDGVVDFQGHYCNYKKDDGKACMRKKSSLKRKKTMESQSGTEPATEADEYSDISEYDTDDEEAALKKPDDDKEPEKKDKSKDGGASTEEKAAGSVPIAMYLRYFRACGGLILLALVLIVFAITELFNAANFIWLTIWSQQTYGLTQDMYLYVYIGIIVLMTTSSAIRASLVFYVMRKGSFTLHKQLLDTLSIGRSAFFDTTPLGRVLNRFSRDISKIDNDLPSSFLGLLQQGFNLIDNMIVMAVSQPGALVPLVIFGGVYYRILVFYNASNREIKRIASVRNSPLFALLTEVLNGTSTIRAFGKVRNVMKEANSRIDAVLSTTLLMHTSNRWLGIRMDLLGNITVTVVALSSVIMHQTGKGPQSVGMLSLAFTVASSITASMNWMIRSLAAVESDMNAVERVAYYIDEVPTEEAWTYGADRTKPNETDPGALEFQNVQLRYRPELPLVLDDVSFRIPNGAKVGVVGRSGSGKSTLMQAMLRAVDTTAGDILICGASIRRFTLQHLRAKFAMIPQEPLLFEGTLRSNLDPFDTSNDVDVWNALSRVGLEESIKKLDGGLRSTVTDGGSNFSVGQRQLLCLARALLKTDTSYILMDEATANIDHETDQLIQKTVKEAFVDKTVITIAHRLHTVASSDLILVMNPGGLVGEFAAPQELLADEDSIFSTMVKALNDPEEERKIHDAAASAQ